ncbi:MAG: pre-peptidase C-terminal domain-containing protein [Deltaproteobacteria bacterium]|nr:pre-peptidase C-terminal domain-containing protein [Deltaproteobacteria bacterium]
MTTTRSSRTLFASLLCAVSLLGCSDDKKPARPDAGGGDPDAAVIPDAPGRTCVTATVGPQEIGEGANDGFISFSGPVTTPLGDGGDSTFALEFYGGLEPTLAAPIDLSAGNQSNYATCAVCLRVFSTDATGMLARQFFQDSGTVTLTEEPFTNKKMIGSATDVTLVEVTVDPEATPPYTSTEVVGGVCITLGNLTLNADAIPAAWTCADAAYEDGANCDCACGAVDPDCEIATAPVVGCTTGQICSEAVCTDVCNVLSTPPVGCPAAGGGVCGYETSTQDICYTDPTIVDPALLGAACGANTTFCAVANTVAAGVCDRFIAGDGVCREACDATADCNAGQVCSPFLGTKGVCETAAANDTCATAVQLTIGTPVTGTTVGGVSNYNLGLEPATCTGFAQRGSDVTYRVTLTANQVVTVALSDVSAGFDPSLALLGPGGVAVCTASPVVCLAGADAGVGGGAETFTFTTTAAGNYYVIVDAFSATRAGTFTLTVTSP